MAQIRDEATGEKGRDEARCQGQYHRVLLEALRRCSPVPAASPAPGARSAQLTSSHVPAPRKPGDPEMNVVVLSYCYWVIGSAAKGKWNSSC